MILGNFAEHLKAQNWFAVGIEISIVIIGVFMGIQVSNWNEDHQNRQIAESYLERLKGDLQIELKHFGHLQNYFGAARTHAINALDAYSRPANELGVNFLIDLYQASQQWNLTPRRGTYNELLATGRIDLISNETTRAMLNNYYESGASRAITFERNSYSDYRKIIRMAMDEAIQSEIREKCDDDYIVSDDNYYYLELPEACDIDVPGDLLKSNIAKLLGDEQIRQELRFQLSTIDSLLGSIKNGAVTAELALARLGETAQ